MTQSDRPRAVMPSDLDLLVERVGAWYSDLRAARDQAHRVMAHPATELFLSEPANDESNRSVLPDPGRSSDAHSEAISEDSVLPWDLQQCTTQESVCDYLASSNDGLVDLISAATFIRRLGLSTTGSDSSLRKNLGTRLVRTGRWGKEGTWKYRQRDWDSRQYRGLYDGGETVESPVPVSEIVGMDESDGAPGHPAVFLEGQDLT